MEGSVPLRQTSVSATPPGVYAEPMVSMQGVTKHFGAVMALRGINLRVARGHCLGVFGPNGAGKTTLLQILATLTRPSAGTVSIAGFDALREAAKVRPFLGVLSHRTFLYGHLTAVENLQFYGRMFAVASLPARIAEVLETVGLETHSRQLVRTYSRGMQQRLAIARVILHRPALLLLDEPYTGLDQHAVRRLQALLRELRAAGCTMIMSTHDLGLGLELCDELVIQHRGRIVHQVAAADVDPTTFEQYYLQHVES